MTYTSTFVSMAEIDSAAWLALMTRTPLCSVELHPTLLERSAGRKPVVYAARDGDRLDTLAVLTPHKMAAMRQPRLRWLGALAGLRVAGDGLVGRSDAGSLNCFVDAVAALLAQARAEYIYFEDIERGSLLWKILAERDCRDVWIEHPHAARERRLIRFPDPPEAYWNRFSSKSHSTMRRAAQRFEHTLEVVTEPGQVRRFLGHVERISRDGWQGKRLGLRIADDRIYRDRLGTLARLGALRSYMLYHHDRPVAFVYGWQWAGRYYYAETAHLQEFAGYGPGNILLYRLVEDLMFDSCPSVLDFGCGDGEHKRRFATDRTATGPVLMLPRTAKARLFSTLRQGERMADQRLRQVLYATGLYDWMRHLHRHPDSALTLLRRGREEVLARARALVDPTRRRDPDPTAGSGTEGAEGARTRGQCRDRGISVRNLPVEARAASRGSTG